MPTTLVHTASILTVDDEPAILRALGVALRAQGYVVTAAGTGEQAVAKVAAEAIDLVVLDLGLPGMSGIEAIRAIRAFDPGVSIVVLSAWAELETRVEALDAGADDYVGKPFGMPELLARIRVGLRHREARIQQQRAPEVVDAGTIRVDADQRIALVSGERLELTPRQFEVLSFLVRNAGRVLTRSAITRAVWQTDSSADENLRVVISQLRRKLGDESGSPAIIVTELGIGYRFVPQTRPTSLADETPSIAE